MSAAFAILKLIRWPNLLIMASILMVVRYGFLWPLSFETYLNWWQHFIFSLATILIAAGGNAVNDAHDVAADRLNKPEKMAIGKSLEKSTAMFIGEALLLSGSLLGLALGYLSDLLTFANIFPLAALLLFLYAKKLKRTAFIGNLTIAFLAGLLVFNAAIFDVLPTLKMGDRAYQIQAVWVIAVLASFSLVLTLARELIKDLQDIDGDRQAGYKTLPIVSGTSVSKILSIVLLMITVASVGWLIVKTIEGHDWYSGVYLIIFVTLPMLYCIIAIAPASNAKAFGQISTILKWVMVSGLFSLLFFTLSVKYFLA